MRTIYSIIGMFIDLFEPKCQVHCLEFAFMSISHELGPFRKKINFQLLPPSSHGDQSVSPYKQAVNQKVSLKLMQFILQIFCYYIFMK